MLDYDYDVGENYAVIGLRLICKAAKGSLPQYQWFLNKTLLHAQGWFYYVVHQPPEQSMLLLSVGQSSAGTYHCEVSDSFDNSTTITSKSWYLDKEGTADSCFQLSILMKGDICLHLLILLLLQVSIVFPSWWLLLYLEVSRSWLSWCPFAVALEWCSVSSKVLFLFYLMTSSSLQL